MRTAVAVAAAIAVLAGMHAEPRAADVAAFELPAPTGDYAVGTTTWRVTDATRRETFADADEPRSIEILAWYPAATSAAGQLAPYLREGLAEVRTFATVMRAPESTFDALDGVKTHAITDAPAADSPRRFPVLVFSHGYTGVPSSYTALLEELASHGYVVLSVVHPYEATAATLADGRMVSMLDAAGALPARLREVFDEWAREDETLAAVTRTTDDREQLRLLREYITSLPHTTAALRRWVDDTKLALDRPPERLADRLDMSRVGVFGHSMGGVTAAAFCLEDRRCRAGLNLDGSPQYGSMIDGSMPRPFLMVYSARSGRLGASDAIYRRAARPYYRVDVRDTQHLDFSDMVFWNGPLRDRPALGSIAPARITDITRRVVREYFDQTLLGRRSPLLAGTPTFPEATVRSLAPPRIIGGVKR